MKILGICGSPRDGNSDWMVKQLTNNIIFLRNKKISFCTGCDHCFNTGEDCVINDDFKEIKNKLSEADLIIFGTPNYFRNVPALLKNFMDRTNSLLKQNTLEKKKAIILCVGGQPLENTQVCEDIMKRFCEDHKMEIIATYKAKADKPGEIKDNKGVKEELLKLKQLCRSV